MCKDRGHTSGGLEFRIDQLWCRVLHTTYKLQDIFAIFDECIVIFEFIRWVIGNNACHSKVTNFHGLAMANEYISAVYARGTSVTHAYMYSLVLLNVRWLQVSMENVSGMQVMHCSCNGPNEWQ